MLKTDAYSEEFKTSAEAALSELLAQVPSIRIKEIVRELPSP
jgi:hypothetical protein